MCPDRRRSRCERVVCGEVVSRRWGSAALTARFGAEAVEWVCIVVARSLRTRSSARTERKRSSALERFRGFVSFHKSDVVSGRCGGMLKALKDQPARRGIYANVFCQPKYVQVTIQTPKCAFRFLVVNTRRALLTPDFIWGAILARW